MDTPLKCEDVELIPSTVRDLWLLQEEWFSNRMTEQELLTAIDALDTE
jgi:hypothetical protein